MYLHPFHHFTDDERLLYSVNLKSVKQTFFFSSLRPVFLKVESAKPLAQEIILEKQGSWSNLIVKPVSYRLLLGIPICINILKSLRRVGVKRLVQLPNFELSELIYPQNHFLAQQFLAFLCKFEGNVKLGCGTPMITTGKE